MTPRLATLIFTLIPALIPPLLVASLAGLPSVPALAQDVSAIVKAADHYRMTADNLQVDTQVQLFNADGTLNKEHRYTVFAQAGRQSLVLMQSPAEKGQKVLMLGDDFWLLMPNSQRPLRITPMQKLLGDASTGDIATLSWAGDYTATLVGEEACAATGAEKQEKLASVDLSDSIHCYHISLQASRKGVTYQRIELWVGKQRREPVRANLYVQSDKLAKQAHFVLDKPGAGAVVSDMLLVDQLGNQKVTRVSYLSRKERTVPAEWLNPMFLARNPSLE
ncbi:MAG: outer membrane lipoprotein-sorting protein [Burkholderiaceae bacterium]|nr:outer membrane lipoprotein-sorting protein [Burkholderiaceae bacterium]